MNNAVIEGLEIWLPEKEVDNDYFIKELEKKGVAERKLKIALRLMEDLGRDKRYVPVEEKNSLDMAVKVSEKLLSQVNTDIEDIDMIKFASDSPEYTTPCNAIRIANKLGAHNVKKVSDINTNCLGLTTAFDEASRYMLAMDYKKTLVISSIDVNSFVRKDDPYTYPTLTSGSCAVLLSQKSEENKRGFIDSINHTGLLEEYLFEFPRNGMKKLLDKETKIQQEKLKFTPHNVDFLPEVWSNLALELIDKNNLNKSDIEHWIFSQFDKKEVYHTLDELHVSHDKTTYVGDKYGYTGNSSPFLALYDAIQENKVSRGDNIILTSVGAGYTITMILYQF